jgi:hypothetical protein
MKIHNKDTEQLNTQSIYQNQKLVSPSPAIVNDFDF